MTKSNTRWGFTQKTSYTQENDGFTARCVIPPCFNAEYSGRNGFTLVELLVVVLIIGILAAVALPQYQKAVEKSKAAEAFVVLKSVYPAVQNYYLEHGEWPTSFSALDINIPYTGNKKWSNNYSKDVRSNQDWSLQLYNSIESGGDAIHLVMGRIAGRYKGGGFRIPLETSSHGLAAMRIYCVERKSAGIIFQGDPGDYCSKLFHGTKLTPEANTVRVYRLP